MSDTKPFRLQLLVLPQRTKHVINTLNNSATLYDLQREIETLTKLSIKQQHLTTGFPPKPIDTKTVNANNTLLTDLGIRHGDTVEVRNSKDVSDSSTVQKGSGTGFLSGSNATTTPAATTTIAPVTDRLQSNSGATSSTATIARDSTPEKPQPTIVPLNTTAPTTKTNGTTSQSTLAPYTSPDGWNCSVCTLFNLNSRTTCAACDTPNPHAVSNHTTTAAPTNGVTDTPTGLTPDSIDDATVWNCDKCTYANTITVPRCRACNARNPHFEAIRDPEEAVEDQLIGGPAERRSDDWECTRCRARNSNYNMSCATCRASRLLSLPINTRAPPTHNAPAATTQNGDGTQTRASRLTRFIPRTGLVTYFRGKNPYTCVNCNTVQQRQVIRCKNCGTINTQRIADRAAQSQAMAQQGGGYGGGPMMMPMCNIM